MMCFLMGLTQQCALYSVRAYCKPLICVCHGRNWGSQAAKPELTTETVYWLERRIRRVSQRVRTGFVQVDQQGRGFRHTERSKEFDILRSGEGRVGPLWGLLAKKKPPFPR